MIIHKICQNLATAQRGKQKNLKNPTMYWQPAWTYCLYIMISEFLPQNLVILAHFFSQNSFNMSHTGLFSWFPSSKNLPGKRKRWLSSSAIVQTKSEIDIKSINILLHTSKLNLNFLLYLQVPQEHRALLLTSPKNLTDM